MMRALFYKEMKEHVLSRKGLWIYFALSILLSAMAFSFVTFKELSLLAQVEVNMTFLKILLGVGILISIIIGSTMISNEKEQGTLESLLLTPLSNLKIMVVKAATICVFWFGVLLISLPYFFALTYGTQFITDRFCVDIDSWNFTGLWIFTVFLGLFNMVFIDKKCNLAFHRYFFNHSITNVFIYQNEKSRICLCIRSNKSYFIYIISSKGFAY